MGYVFEEGESQTGYPQQRLIIDIKSLNITSLSIVYNILFESAEVIVNRAKESSDDVMWVSCVHTNEGLLLPEKIIWEMICHFLPDADKLIIKYVDRLCELAHHFEYNELLNHDEHHPMGSFAIVSLLDRVMARPDSETMKAMPTYQCFINFLHHCDMEHETFQDQYIKAVLNKLKFFNAPAYISLLCFRLCTGQLAEKDFRYLYHFLDNFTVKPAYLREVIDYATDPNNTDLGGFTEHTSELYLSLCAAIYGNNIAETKDVMRYVAKRMGDRLLPPEESSSKYIQWIRDECDAFRKCQLSTENVLDSSFHLYHLNSKNWRQYN